MNSTDETLKGFYYDHNKPTSFRGIQAIFDEVKQDKLGYTINDVKNWLGKQRVYQIHSKPKHKFRRNPIVSKYIDHIWNADLVEIINPRDNDGYRYILMVIDNLSKYGWAEPLLNKKAITIIKSFNKILSESQRKPSQLATDAGIEFTNMSFEKLMKSLKIKHFIVRDGTKAAIVERWNQTIKSIIHKYLSHHNTKRFIDV